MQKDRSIIEESILNAALQLLQDRKYRTTSVTMLSRQAGVSRSSFYRCFHHKDDVLCRLLQRELVSPSACEMNSKNPQLQRWIHTLQSHDSVLELYYTNGYSELAREQIIALFAGSPADTVNYYKKVFLAGGILSIFETWKKGC